MCLRKKIFGFLFLLAFFSSIQAEDALEKSQLLNTSMQQLLREQYDFVGQNVLVQGYLSANCASLCLFAYEDDAVHWNVANSITIIADYKVIEAISSNCIDRYVAIAALVGVLEGYPRPSLISISSIRETSQSKKPSSICWLNKALELKSKAADSQ